mmetsp:Transcript_5013/g.5762  ORF Transcript_5013/g.5762 Transcript_5013/m.5762 type:complete len:97 (-) Transcript_5013:388-678(-)
MGDRTFSYNRFRDLVTARIIGWCPCGNDLLSTSAFHLTWSLDHACQKSQSWYVGYKHMWCTEKNQKRHIYSCFVNLPPKIRSARLGPPTPPSFLNP